MSIKKHFFLGISFLLLISCSGNEGNPTGQGDSNNDLTEKQELAIAYFKEIALGFEFGNASEVTRKWASDVVIFVGGEPNEMLLNELDDIINDLNDLIKKDSIMVTTTGDSLASNFYLFLGSGEEFERRFEPSEGYTASNYGLFWVYWNGNNELNRGAMYVDLYRPAALNQRHLLREELTQSLGMAKDSPKYTDSIFQSSYNNGTATKFSELDEAVIQMLYHPEVSTGLAASQVHSILENIVSEFIE
jgi:hypothetical protein